MILILAVIPLWTGIKQIMIGGALLMDSTNISTREEQAKVESCADQDARFIDAKKRQYAAENRDSGNQHRMPLVVTVGGQTIYTRDNF